MKLYHGSIQQVLKPNLFKCRKNTDFGKGFYTTTNYDQAAKWALLKKDRAQSENAIVSVYEFNNNVLESDKLKVMKFLSASNEWLEFVANNRKEGVITDFFDIVFGPVANDTIYATLSLYEQGILSADATIEQLKTHKLFNQISFHSILALNELNFIESVIANK